MTDSPGTDFVVPEAYRPPEDGWLPGVRGFLQMSDRLKSTCGATPQGWRFSSVEALLLHYGRSFTPTRLDEIEPEEGWSPLERGEKKECFANALHACLYNGWSYAEGYAVSIIPTLHAWVFQPARPDEAVDPTWEDGTGREYFGIAFDTDWAMATIVRSGRYGIFGGEVDDVIVPLLEHGIPDSALA